MNNRRPFVKTAGIFAVTYLANLGKSLAQSRPWPLAPGLSEADPVASTLGFRQKGCEVDTLKFPRYRDGQCCAACTQFPANEQEARCEFFNRSVPETGWCSAYASRRIVEKAGSKKPAAARA